MAGGGVESRGVLTFLASKLRPINCEPWAGRRQVDVATSARRLVTVELPESESF